ncbi:NACHT domain-containing protein [Ralstonia pseudosolanacearum]|uniref:NACHT domain-containing protein n=1 Tax=Ralstonia pseudosolanacearum TaxID=1310165 RepID=UPI003CF5C1DF
MAEIGIASALATGAAKGIATEMAKSLMQTSMKGLKNISEEIITSFTDRFGAYIHSQLEKHAHINTLVFGNQKPLEELYIPLTALPSPTMCGADKEVNITLRDYDPQFLPHFRRVLITDTAGMGKSTLLRFLFIKCIEQKQSVPIFIELRHLTDKQGILDHVLSQLNVSLTSEEIGYFNRQRIERIFKKGSMVMLLDGYDEIPFQTREAVTIQIKRFIERFPNNTFAITSRPESGLHAFGEFKQFTLRPLHKEEAFSLIRKYDAGEGRGELLIKQIENKELEAISEFLQNPLLVTLLFRCFEYKQKIPLRKHVFYRQVYDALYDWHDATKDGYNTREKKSKLDIDAFHRVLRVIGYTCTMRGQIETDKDGFLGWIRDARKICSGLSFSESDFLEDAIRAVPVFVRDGSHYRWSHKSLAEYFATQFLCTEGKHKQDEVLKQISLSRHSDRFFNVLDQLYDVDHAAFRKHFFTPLKERFKEYASKSYRGLDARIPADIIRIRRGICFSGTHIIGQFKDGRKFSEEANERFLKPLMSDSQNRRIEMCLLPRHEGNSAIAAIHILGADDVTLRILDQKKDPAMLPRTSIDLPDVKPRISGLSKFEEVTDDPRSILNSFDNFAATTKILATHWYAVNTQYMLEQEEDENGTSALDQLTSRLLQELSTDEESK